MQITELTNHELANRCLRGDEAAWLQLVNRYARLVHSIPVRHGLTPTEVDDVGQDVFLALAQNLDKIEDYERLPAWLITTARRFSWRALQKRRREEPTADSDLAERETRENLHNIGARIPSMQELLAGWQRQEALTQGLRQLGERCRNLVTMLFLDSEEPSYETISSQLGIPTGSIGPTRNRCLQQLRLILEGLGFTHDS